MRKSFEMRRDSTMRQTRKCAKRTSNVVSCHDESRKPLVAPRSDQGFLAYACIVRRRPAKAWGFHATFEGLFEQNAQRAIRSLHMWRRTRQAFLRAATEISPCAATGISLCAALAKAHASNCDGDNRDYERP